MNLIKYVEKFGHISLEEKRFNEVDSLVFCTLSYIDLGKCVPHIEDNKEGIYLNDLHESKMSFGLIRSFANDRKTLLKLVKKAKRYEKIKLNYFEEYFSIEEEIQFYVYTYTLPNNFNFICFRGTDESVVGRKEDLKMAVENKILSHYYSSNYVEKILNKSDNPVVITGHSKGGNLAFYSMIDLYDKYGEKMIYAINFDGPGFIDKEFIKKAKNQKLYEKLVKIVPECSIIGMLLNEHKRLKIVNSEKYLLLQHDPVSWMVDSNGDFYYQKHRNKISIISESALSEWISSINIEERKILVEKIIDIIGGTSENLATIAKHPLKSFKNIYRNYSFTHPEDKELIKKHFKNLHKIYKKFIKEYKFNNLEHNTEKISRL